MMNVFNLKTYEMGLNDLARKLKHVKMKYAKVNLKECFSTHCLH